MKHDEQSRQTKQVLSAALKRLMEEKPLNKITIQELVEECGVNRKTFYYHFEDLPSLIYAIVMEDAERTIQESFVINSLWECFESVINFALKRRRVAMHIYNSSNRAIYEQQLFMICEHAVTQYVEKLLGDLDGLQVQDNDKRIIIKAYTCECYGQIVNWLSSGMKEGFRQDMIRLCRLREGEVRELLVRSTRI